MEKAVAQNLLQVALHDESRQPRAVESQAVNAGSIIDLDTRQVLQHQNLRVGVLPQNLGHTHPVHALKVGTEGVGVLALNRVVNLLVEDAAALVVDGHPVTRCTVRLGVHLLQPHRQGADVLAVNVKQLLQTRALHLDHHPLSSCLDARQVHLTQGSCRYGDLLPLAEHLLNRLAKVGLHNLAGGLRVKGRHVVLQLLQLLDELGCQHVHSRTELLPDLDEGGAQAHQTLTQPDGQLLLTR
mmetsp:Transcript_29729/g.65785  ORF Transcript_29729/g.65785 Transcript_29729/m.65785 type:complete len:241 (+) Transcript_29729:2112-2834(+)